MKISHTLEIISGLKSIVNAPTLSDVKILVGKEKKEFYASSLLLAARSPIFKEMYFSSGAQDQKLKVLELQEVNPTHFLAFLEYINTGEIEISEKVRF